MDIPSTQNSELRSQDSSSPPVAKLAAKVAHELNNPLDAVLRLVSLAQRKNQLGIHADVQRHLADAQTGLTRMAEILRELMDLGLQTHEILAQPHRAPLGEILSQSLRTVAALAEQKHVRLFLDNSVPSDRIPAFDSRLAQILSNLLKNALEASPENSSVQITAGIQTSPADPANQQSLFTGHWPLTTDHLSITVEDHGPGIDPQLLPRLFTPFLTTKPRGKGHGLGLAISRDLALSLGGTLTLENMPESGCVARISIPAVLPTT